MFCKFGFHKYIELGFQNSTLVVIDGSPSLELSRSVKIVGKSNIHI